MSEEKKYFLFQSGQTFGPYLFSELQKMNENKELEKYDLFWDMGLTHWKPLPELLAMLVTTPNAPTSKYEPPPPTDEEIQIIKKSQSPDALSPPPTHKKKSQMQPPLTTLMFDDASTSPGVLLKITKNRCFIQSIQDDKRPSFVIGQNLKIHFLSEITLNSFHTDVKLQDIRFDGQYWISELLWINEKPTELLDDLKE